MRRWCRERPDRQDEGAGESTWLPTLFYLAVGNRLTQQETNGGGAETTTYVYDNNDRLTRADYSDATVSYGYDAAYNRTGETAVEKAGGTTVSSKTFSYNNRNQVTSISDSANAANDTTYSYDANGNQTVKTRNGHTLTFVYDVRDRLVRVSQDTTTLGQFRYDHAGMRIQKEGAQGIVRYTYDDGSVLLQTDGAGTTLAKYDYGPDRLLSLEQVTEGEQFYHFDALGSVVNLSKPDGSLQARYQYDAWGNERATTGSSWNRFAFTGHEKDEETGLYYFKARFYDPQLGRFLSQDGYLGEVENAPSLHRYLYAYANPTVWIDLTGYQSEVPCFGSGCTPSLTEEEQVQREIDRQALLDKKPSPSENIEEQQGTPKGSETIIEDEQGLGSKIEGSIDWFNKKREQLKEKISEHIVAPFEESKRKYLEDYYKGRGGDSPEIASQKAEAGASAAADNSKKEARKFVDTAEEMATGGAIGKGVGAAVGVAATTGKLATKNVDTVLYQKVDKDGNHLKFGIAKIPEKNRYTTKQMNGGKLKILARGEKKDMLKLERDLHETLPIGPEEGQKIYIKKQVEKGLKPPPYGD